MAVTRAHFLILQYLGSIPRSANPRGEHQGHLPMQSFEVDSAEWPENRAWELDKESLYLKI